MPALVGSDLNVVFSASVSPADQAGGLGFVGVNIDLSGGRVAAITGFEFCCRVTGADLANLQFAQFAIFRDIALSVNNPIGPQVSGITQVVNALSSTVADRTVARQFMTPLRLDNASRFACLGQGLFGAALGAGITLTLSVFGQSFRQGDQPFPLEFR